MRRALWAVLLLGALVLQPLARRLLLRTAANSRVSYRQSTISKKDLLPVPAAVCNLFEGQWVLDDNIEYPLYKPGSCPFVEDSFSCTKNGRPDSNFTRWHWQPHGCPLPRFHGKDMLESLRGKRVVFVGDSLSRNQWESLLCLLYQALPNHTGVVEVNGHQISKGIGFFDFVFQDYDCHIEFYSSHFLVEEEYDVRTKRMQLRLDLVHKSHSRWSQADVLIFTTGHWWTRGKTAKGKNFYREGNRVHPKLNLMVAFTKALQTWANWVDSNLISKKTRVFFVGYSPGHFRGGKWNTGGGCEKGVEPIADPSHILKYREKSLAIEQTLGRMKYPVKLLNVTGLSSYRSDGHPSIYGLKNTHDYQDCSHWCLPGVPDVWNVLLYALLIKDFKS